MAWEHRRPRSFTEGENEGAAAIGEPWVLLCGVEDFCGEARREMLRRRRDLRAVAAEGLACAREFLEAGELPAAILVEERVLTEGAAAPRQRRQALVAGLSLLAGYAPVVWIGAAEDAVEISAGLGGAADFVPRSALCVPAAINMLERRLRTRAASLEPGRAGGSPDFSGEISLQGRDFGEVLRHELNNPLTGILGNAELLLLEARRGSIQLPAHNLQRLETITDLAVRMRETVRLLSDRWEAAGENPSEGKEGSREQPHWPGGG